MSELGAIRDAVTAYFDRRPNVPTRAWDEFVPAEHALGFTVARSAGFDILDDVRAGMRRAMLDGVPFERFSDELEPLLKAKGWWGERRSSDGAGGVTVEQIGSARRLKLIYDANIRSAQAAGEWADIQANKGFLPWLEYVVSLSERKRREHLGWVGTTLPVDDVWWRTHYPPNGWNCKCRVRPRAQPRDDLTPAQRRRPPLDLQPWRSRSTGESRLVPKGIDPGWEGNAGMTRARLVGQELTRRIERMGDDARRATVARLRDDPAYGYIAGNGGGFEHKRKLEPAMAEIGRIRWPVAILSDALASRLEGAGASRVVVLSAADAAKIGAQKHGIDLTGLDLQELLDRDDLAQSGRKIVLPRLIGGRPHVVVIKASAAGELFLNSIHMATEDQWRKVVDAAGRS